MILTVPDPLTDPWACPTQSMAQDHISAPSGRQLLHQWHRSTAGLQLPTAFLCPVMSPAKPGPPAGPCPSLTFACAQWDAWRPGLGLLQYHPTALPLAGWWDRHWGGLQVPAPRQTPAYAASSQWVLRWCCHPIVMFLSTINVSKTDYCLQCKNS